MQLLAIVDNITNSMNDMHTIGVVLQFLCMFYLGDGMNTNDDDDNYDYHNLFTNYINYNDLATLMDDQNLANANIEGNQLPTKSINEPSLPTSNSNMSKDKNVVISNKNETNGISANNNRTVTKRKRSRGKQQLTQVVHTDVANFRQVVQHLTSAPEWRRPIHNDAASIRGLNIHDGRLNHSLTAPNQSTAAHNKAPSKALDGTAFQYEGHSFPILESSRPFDDVTKQ